MLSGTDVAMGRRQEAISTSRSIHSDSTGPTTRRFWLLLPPASRLFRALMRGEKRPSPRVSLGSVVWVHPGQRKRGFVPVLASGAGPLPSLSSPPIIRLLCRSDHHFLLSPPHPASGVSPKILMKPSHLAACTGCGRALGWTCGGTTSPHDPRHATAKQGGAG